MNDINLKTMKKIISVLVLALSFMSLTSLTLQNKAEFKFEHETHDFGRIPQGKPVSYEFKFTNTGTEPLIISKVESTCGCTVPEFTTAPVQPGAQGTIKVTFDAAAASPFSKMVTIRSNAKTPVKALYIKGVVQKN
jgi:hypothetical protein